MTYVGGGGAYVMETTYRFVGEGQGDFDLKHVRGPNLWPLCAGIVTVVLASLLAAFLLLSPWSKGITSFDGPFGAARDCELWGVAHTMSFDRSYPMFFDEGDFWIVKADAIHVQGRYLASPSRSGLVALQQVSVGGPFMEGNTLIVGPLGHGEITCNGKPILLHIPSEATCGPARLSYDDKLIDGHEAQVALDKHVVHVNVPKFDVHLQVVRWDSHLNAKIRSPKWTNQDGVCGNANGDPADDFSEAIQERLGGRVSRDALLFHAPTSASGSTRKHITDCSQDTLKHSVEICKSADKSMPVKILDACIWDVCFAGDALARQDAIVAAGVRH